MSIFNMLFGSKNIDNHTERLLQTKKKLNKIKDWEQEYYRQKVLDMEATRFVSWVNRKNPG